MASLSWSDLTTPKTEAQFEQDILDLLDGLGFAATSWQEGSVVLACVKIGAFIGSRVSDWVATLAKAQVNATSTGTALDAFSESVYDNTRVAAVETQGVMLLACSATDGPHSIALGAVVATDGTRTFRNVAGLAVSYPATLASGGTLQLLFEAEVAGADGNIPTSSTLALVTTLAGVTITNPAYSAGTWITRQGVDRESDARLQQRNSSKWGALPAFELIDDSVEQICLAAAPGIIKVGIDSQNPRGENTFDVYLAGASAPAGVDDIAAALAALQARVMGSDVVRCYAAPTVTLNLVGTVYYDSNFEEADVKAAVEAALQTYVDSVPLGGFDFSPGPSSAVPKNNIEKAIENTKIGEQEVVKTATLSTPAGDVSVTSFGVVTRGDWTTLVYQPV